MAGKFPGLLQHGMTPSLLDFEDFRTRQDQAGLARCCSSKTTGPSVRSRRPPPPSIIPVNSYLCSLSATATTTAYPNTYSSHLHDHGHNHNDARHLAVARAFNNIVHAINLETRLPSDHAQCRFASFTRGAACLTRGSAAPQNNALLCLRPPSTRFAISSL
jgi:hypothetical protein